LLHASAFRRPQRWAALAALPLALSAACAQPLAAQTDFHNLDKDRPLRVEDALAGKFRSLEFKFAPLEFTRFGADRWEMEPQFELKAGILPGIEASAGYHPSIVRAGGETSTGAGTFELSTLASLWNEAPRLPAAALRATAHLPARRGEEAGHGSSVELRGILTRSISGPVRLHLNGAGILGEAPERAWFGAALDWVLPFRHTLLLAEGWTNLVEEGDATVHAGVGVRTQLAPTVVLDLGLGHDLAGAREGSWHLRLGLTREFGLRAWRGRPRAAAGPGAEGSGARGSGIVTPVSPPASAEVRPPRFERVAHPFMLVADHNGVFRTRHGDVDRLFNAFDFGHGILYETLLTRPDAPVALLEEEIFRRLAEEILPAGPRMPMPEASFMPRYVQLAPRAHEMFEWAHVLHRQAYDVLADPSLSEAERDLAMADLLEHYVSSDLAFPVEPKGMAIMDEQYFSKAFREKYPRMNGLIWAYHWLQVAVYEPLLVYDEPAARRAGVQAAVTRFWQMLEDPPEALPSEMPMTPAIAPAFTERYPEFAVIFDNLHMMHDVVSDILVSEAVAREELGAELYRQVLLFLDPGVLATSREAWIAMALAHGVDAQGGPAVGWLPEVPTRGSHGGGHDDPHSHHEPQGRERP
jgi:hypothetical protein